MGTSIRPADALFSSVQQRVLALLFGHSERSFGTGELIRLAKGGTGGVHRLIRRLADAGWVTVTPVGNQRYYRANRSRPGFQELHDLVARTIGAARVEGASKKKRPSTSKAPSREEAASPAPPADESWKSW